MPRNKNMIFSTKDVDGDLHVTCKTLGSRTMTVLNEWRQEGCCDLHIKVGKHMVPGHKCILAVHSDYFKAMFASGMEESHSQQIRLDGVNHMALSGLVNFMYTGQLKVSVDLAQDLVILSDMLQMQEVKDLCTTYMQRHLDTNNCIGIKEFGEKYGCLNLVTKAMTLIKQRFQGVAQAEEFMSLSLDGLIELLKCSDLNLGPPGEDVALEAAVQWLEHEAATRSENFSQVLQNIHIQNVTTACLEKVRGLAVVRENSDILAALDAPRRSGVRTPVHHIYVIGGYLQSRTGPSCPRLKTVERYNVQADEWIPLAPLPTLASSLEGFNIQGHLIVFASDFHPIVVTKIYEYNHLEDLWKDLSENTPSSVLALVQESFLASCAMTYCSQRKCIYILTSKKFCQLGVSEEDGDIVFGEVTQLLKLTLDMEDNYQLDDLIMTVCSGEVYVIGGTLRWSNLQFQPLNTVWRYDNGTWTKRASMYMPRGRVGVVSMADEIYAIGGFNKYRERSGERYSVTTNTWERISNMEKHRSFFCAVTVSGKIWALGGKSYAFGCGGARKVLNTVECYDTAMDQWRTVSPMRQCRCCFSAVVL